MCVCVPVLYLTELCFRSYSFAVSYCYTYCKVQYTFAINVNPTKSKMCPPNQRKRVLDAMFGEITYAIMESTTMLIGLHV